MRSRTYSGNKTGGYGGAIHSDDETVMLSGSMVFGNQSDNCRDVPGFF